jgi:hypothetical protein
MTKRNYNIVIPAVISNEYVFQGEAQKDVGKSNSSITTSVSSTNNTSYLQTNSMSNNDWIELKASIPAAGTYDVAFQYKTNTSGRATVQPYVNGVAMGLPINENGAQANVFVTVNLGQVTIPAPGIYPVRFVVTSPGAIVIDYIQFAVANSSAPASSNTSIQLASAHPNLTSVDSVTKAVYASNGATVAQIIAQIVSTDSSVQSYAVTDGGNTAKSSNDTLVTGDKLVIKAADAVTAATYTIHVAAANVSLNTNIQPGNSHANVLAINQLKLR